MKLSISLPVSHKLQLCIFIIIILKSPVSYFSRSWFTELLSSFSLNFVRKILVEIFVSGLRKSHSVLWYVFCFGKW